MAMADIQSRIREMSGAHPDVANFANGLMGMFSHKGKGAPEQPPQMQVPQATSGFYQPSNPAARSQLLQSMMQRSRAGRQMGA